MGLIIAAFLFSIAHAEEGRVLTNPVDTLKSNECIFKQKNIATLQGYDYIVDACDRRYTSYLTLISDHLKQGTCVYNLVQKMTGYTIARVVKSCPVQNQEQVPQLEPDNIIDEDIGALPPPPPDEAAAAKPVVKKKATTQKPAEAKDKDNQDVPEIKNYVAPAVDQDF